MIRLQLGNACMGTISTPGSRTSDTFVAQAAKGQIALPALRRDECRRSPGAETRPLRRPFRRPGAADVLRHAADARGLDVDGRAGQARHDRRPSPARWRSRQPRSPSRSPKRRSRRPRTVRQWRPRAATPSRSSARSTTTARAAAARSSFQFYSSWPSPPGHSRFAVRRKKRGWPARRPAMTDSRDRNGLRLRRPGVGQVRLGEIHVGAVHAHQRRAREICAVERRLRQLGAEEIGRPGAARGLLFAVQDVGGRKIGLVELGAAEGRRCASSRRA